MSVGKPGWDRDAPLNPGIPAIPDLFEIEKILGKKCECKTIKILHTIKFLSEGKNLKLKKNKER